MRSKWSTRAEINHCPPDLTVQYSSLSGLPPNEAAGASFWDSETSPAAQSPRLRLLLLRLPYPGADRAGSAPAPAPLWTHSPERACRCSSGCARPRRAAPQWCPSRRRALIRGLGSGAGLMRRRAVAQGDARRGGTDDNQGNVARGADVEQFGVAGRGFTRWERHCQAEMGRPWRRRADEGCNDNVVFRKSLTLPPWSINSGFRVQDLENLGEKSSVSVILWKIWGAVEIFLIIPKVSIRSQNPEMVRVAHLCTKTNFNW